MVVGVAVGEVVGVVTGVVGLTGVVVVALAGAVPLSALVLLPATGVVVLALFPVGIVGAGLLPNPLNKKINPVINPANNKSPITTQTQVGQSAFLVFLVFVATGVGTVFV